MKHNLTVKKLGGHFHFDKTPKSQLLALNTEIHVNQNVNEQLSLFSQSMLNINASVVFSTHYFQPRKV
jgi:hypothetical protein